MAVDSCHGDADLVGVLRASEWALALRDERDCRSKLYLLGFVLSFW